MGAGMRELENMWRQQVRERLDSFRQEMGPLGHVYRSEALAAQCEELREHLDEATGRYVGANNPRDRLLIGDRIITLQTHICRREAEKRGIERILAGGNVADVSPDMIEQARGCDVRDLFKVLKGDKVCCPFHDDRQPSATVKRGFFHCFVCGVSHDAIGILMQRDGHSFKEAVRRLCGS